jgi:hypothetical protein
MRVGVAITEDTNLKLPGIAEKNYRKPYATWNLSQRFKLVPLQCTS